jgi:Flp pilus assembly protein TadG
MEASRYNRKHRRQTAGRRGVETLEVVLALPVLLIATIAVFEFGFLILVHQAVTTAAVEGVREAAKDQSTTEATALEVQRILGVHEMSFATTGTNTTDDVRVVVERFGSPTDQVGNTSLLCSPQGITLLPNQIRVTVCIRMTNANGRPVPNWLSSLGFTLVDRRLEASALASAE